MAVEKNWEPDPRLTQPSAGKRESSFKLTKQLVWLLAMVIFGSAEKVPTRESEPND